MNMKIQHKIPASRLSLYALLCSAIAGALTVPLTASAAPAQSVELKVTGMLSMGACYPSFDNGGVVNFGHIGSANLSDTDASDLGKRSINLTVACDNAHAAGFTITDNKSASAMTDGLGPVAGANAFGLGQTAGGVNLGAYSIAMTSVNLDGTAGDVLSSPDGATWTAAANGGLADNSGTTIWSAGTAGVDDAAAAATTFVYGIDVNAVLQDATTLAIADDTDLDGSATFTLVYP